MAEEQIPVPETLRGAHRFVTATREAAQGLKPGEDGRLDLRKRKGVIQLQVARGEIPRALRIAQAIFNEAERRGWEVVEHESAYSSDAGVAIKARGQAYLFKIVEQHDKEPLTDAEIKKWREDHRWRLSSRDREPPTTKNVASGRLSLALETSYGRGRRSNWREGPRGPLEAKLPSFFAELERRSVEDAEAARKREIARAEREREAEIARKRAEERRIEEARGERLVAQAKIWRDVENARAFIAALRSRIEDLEPEERERIKAWCDWGQAWVESADPVANTERVVALEGEEQPSSQRWW